MKISTEEDLDEFSEKKIRRRNTVAHNQDVRRLRIYIQKEERGCEG